jgi:multiple sugar transport system substrate-binding protein
MDAKRWRRTACAVAAGVAMLLAAACGSAGGGSGTSDAGGTVHLRFAGWDKVQAPAMQAVIDAFEAKHKNIKVTFQAIPFNDYAHKMQVQASAGNAADVFWITPGMTELYASEGVAAPIDDRAEESGIDLGIYPESALAQMRYEGKVYGFPRGAATTQLWYNKEIFDAAGVEYPTADWTWDDMKAAAAKLTDKEKEIWGLVALYDGTQSYYNSIFAAGGQVIADDGKTASLDDPKAIEGIRLWADLIEAGSTPRYSQTLETTPDALFMSGKAAMEWGGSWLPGVFAANEDIKDKIDVAPLPAGPAGRKTVLTSNGYSMYAGSKHPEEAWQFLSFLGGPEGLKIQSDSPTVVQPPTEQSAKVWAKHFPQYDMDAILDAPAYGEPWPTSKLTDEWLVAMKDELSKAFELKATPEEASRAADKAIEEVLAKEDR